MIMNLFSIFDPTTNYINFSFNWLRTIIGIIFFPFIYWLLPSRILNFWNFILYYLNKEFKILLGNFSWKGTTLIFISLFSFLLINNFLGLIPYIFTRTSHLRITLSLSLPLWLTFILLGWINNSKHIFAHLVPQGTPVILIPFIVLIERIRNIIRPITLAIRLSANIIAGHLLLTLLGRTGNNLINIFLILLIIIQLLLLILESAVSIIQAYVFSILRTLYSREII